MIPELYCQVTRTAANTTAFRMHSHFCWEILYYTKNKGFLHLEEYPPIPFREGTVICVPPLLPHGSVGEGVFENICVQDKQFPEELRQNGGAYTTHGGCIVFQENGMDLLQLFQMVFRTFIRNEKQDCSLVQHLMVCVHDILLEQCQTSAEGDFQVELLKNSILENFTDPSYRIADGLKAFQYSPSYIRSAFRNSCQMTPVQYLRMVRLKNAAALLQTAAPSMPISEIAYQSGFADPLYFSRCFRQMYQLSPQAWREKSIQEKASSESEETP